MTLNKDGLKELYRKRAGLYDAFANLDYLIGFRDQAYRKKAVAAFDLRRGDTAAGIGYIAVGEKATV